MEDCRNVLCECSLNVPAEGSLNIPFERSTVTFREHCFGTLKNPGHVLSLRNVPMEPSERSRNVLCYGGYFYTQLDIQVLWFIIEIAFILLSI